MLIDSSRAYCARNHFAFVLRLKFPAGFVIPPHRHSKDEFVTVISGGFAVAAGEKLDRNARPLRAASFVHLPAGVPHFAFTTEETVMQINGTGPFDVMHIDPQGRPAQEVGGRLGRRSADQKRAGSRPSRPLETYSRSQWAVA